LKAFDHGKCQQEVPCTSPGHGLFDSSHDTGNTSRVRVTPKRQVTMGVRAETDVEPIVEEAHRRIVGEPGPGGSAVVAPICGKATSGLSTDEILSRTRDEG